MGRVTVVQGDITQLNVDALVNAANETLLGGGGVDGAIHHAAGPELLDACCAVPEVSAGVRCPTGRVRVTPGFRLIARYVIHTVGPVWRGGRTGEPQALADCYDNALSAAAAYGLSSVAFPAISCGVYRFPIEQACEIAVQRSYAFLERASSLQEVVLCAFGDSMYGVLSRAHQAGTT